VRGSDEQTPPDIPRVERRALLAGIGGLAVGTFLGPARSNAGWPDATSTPATPEPRIAINRQNTPGNHSTLHRITDPGSYYLEGNIQGEAGRNGITIEASNVTIDLMGFSLQGVPGSLCGVLGVEAMKNLTLRNGVIAGWSRAGVQILSGGEAGGTLIEGILACTNGGVGICVGNGGTVRHCSSIGNKGSGIVAHSHGTLVNCIVHDNLASGILAGNTGVISGCTAFDNRGAGIHAIHSCALRHCTASSNAGDGISLSGHNTVLDNICDDNGTDGHGAGIVATGTDNRIEGNHCSRNQSGLRILSAGNFLARNICSGSLTLNWDIVPANKCLVIEAAAASAISGNFGGTSPGTTNPWANFTY
jgi:parallel beta-helix repeat protein